MENPSTASLSKIAQEFFDRYNAQDVPSMVSMFEAEATVEYVPFSLAGPVEEVGPGSWGVLIDSFPDLRNKVRSIREGGNFAFADVDIRGTQRKEAFGVPSRGNSYDVRHLFIFEFGEAGSIKHLTAFWDNASWYLQLGMTELPAGLD